MRATLYVSGVRTKFVSDASYQGYVMGGAAQPGQVGRMYPDYKVYRETKYKCVLPEDQKAVVEMAKAAALKYGFELKVVDVAEKDFLRKLEDKLKGINTFPAFVTEDGFKIEGDITEERIKALLKQQTYEQTTKNQSVRSLVVLPKRMRSMGWLTELRFGRSASWFYVGVFVLTTIGLAVLYYRVFALSSLASFLFVFAYVIAWVMLPAFTFDFTRDRPSGKKIIVVTLGVMLFSTLFTHLAWTIASPKWSFSVFTDKSTYRLGEPVIITASLRNTGFITQSFVSLTSDPIQFIIWGKSDPIQFRISGNSLTEVCRSQRRENVTSFSLTVGESLERTFTWNQVDTINGWAWNQTLMSGNRTFVPGTYSIQALIPAADSRSYYFSSPLFSAWTSIDTTRG